MIKIWPKLFENSAFLSKMRNGSEWATTLGVTAQRISWLIAQPFAICPVLNANVNLGWDEQPLTV